MPTAGGYAVLVSSTTSSVYCGYIFTRCLATHMPSSKHAFIRMLPGRRLCFHRNISGTIYNILFKSKGVSRPRKRHRARKQHLAAHLWEGSKTFDTESKKQAQTPQTLSSLLRRYARPPNVGHLPRPLRMNCKDKWIRCWGGVCPMVESSTGKA